MARLAVGCDVAGPGEDETVAYARDLDMGNLVAFQAWLHRDPRGAFVAWLRKLEYDGHDIVVVNIDSVGIGYYFALHVRDIGFPVQEINVGETPEEPKIKQQFRRKKDQYFWLLREAFERNEVGNLTDDLTVSQLTAIEYHHNERGQVEVDSKDDLKARGVGSPDRAEGLMLTFVPPRKARKRRPLPVTMSVTHARS